MAFSRKWTGLSLYEYKCCGHRWWGTDEEHEVGPCPGCGEHLPAMRVSPVDPHVHKTRAQFQREANAALKLIRRAH